MEKTKTKDEIIANKEKVIEFSIEGLRFRVEMDYSQKDPKGKVMSVHRERPIPGPLYPCTPQWLPVCNFAYKAEELYWFMGEWACERCIQVGIKEHKLNTDFTTFKQHHNSLKYYMELTRIS